jgi:hypothetical protein
MFSCYRIRGVKVNKIPHYPPDQTHPFSSIRHFLLGAT